MATMKRSERMWAWAITVTECYGFLCLGMILAMLGPTLLDLSHQVNGTLGQLAYVFTARSTGYLIGCIVGGFLFDRVSNALPYLSGTLACTALSGFLVPTMKTVFRLGAVCSLQGLGMGFLDTGGNVLLLRLWGADCGPYLQALHFSFGLGAFLSPLITKPFLAPVPHSTGLANFTCAANASTTTPIVPTTAATTITETITTAFTTTMSSHATATSSSSAAMTSARLTTTPATTASLPLEITSDIHIPYWTAASCMIPGILVFLYLTFRAPRHLVGSTSHGATTHSGDDHERMVVTSMPSLHISAPRREWCARLPIKPVLVGLAFLFFMLYVGIEVGYGGYIYSYSVKECDVAFTNDQAAMLTSVYWGFFALGRLIAIPLSTALSPLTMVSIDLAGALISSVLIALNPTNPRTLWVCTAIFGASLASVFPSGFHLVETYVEVNAAAASVIVVGAALGEMLIPLLIGSQFDRHGPLTFPTINVWSVAIATGLFGLMLAWVFIKLGGFSSRHNTNVASDLDNATTLTFELNPAFDLDDDSDDEEDIIFRE
eukprot:m.365456 g.365456  ORF g.365456 m.365456 type:complete len:548 (-) comp31491_c0_seq1:128-1771(-)